MLTNEFQVPVIAGMFVELVGKTGAVAPEQMDAIAPTPLVITGAASHAGAIRLTVTAISNADFSVGTAGNPNQNFIEVYGVVGTTEANGSWA